MSQELTAIRNSILNFPVSTLDDITEACTVDALMAGDSRYYDLSSLRDTSGCEVIRKSLLEHARRGEFLHLLYTGHRGSGKTTELIELEEWAKKNGFLPVREEVNREFGGVKLEYMDVCFLAISMVQNSLAEIGESLPSKDLKEFFLWFKEVVLEDTEERKSELTTEVDAQIGGGFSLAKLIAKFSASYKANSSHTVKIREKLRSNPQQLIDRTVNLLNCGNEILKTTNYPKGFLLVFDNMDRFEPVDIDRLLNVNKNLIHDLSTHCIFTFPISLKYQPISSPIQLSEADTTLSTPGLRRRGDEWASTVQASVHDEAKVKRFRELLGKRFSSDLFEDSDDLDLLIKTSGGVIRDLMRMIVRAHLINTGTEKIDSNSVRKAITHYRNDYIRILSNIPNGLKYLVAVERKNPKVSSEFSPETMRSLRFTSCLLEYLDETGEVWEDIHPILIESRVLREACDNPD